MENDEIIFFRKNAKAKPEKKVKRMKPTDQNHSKIQNHSKKTKLFVKFPYLSTMSTLENPRQWQF